MPAQCRSPHLEARTLHEYRATGGTLCHWRLARQCLGDSRTSQVKRNHERNPMKPSTLLSLLVVVLSLSAAARADAPSSLPPGEKDAKATIEKSPRHGEYIDVTVPGSN